MVYAIINISEQANQVLNILKAKYGLKDKSMAIDVMAEKYEEHILAPELKPEFITKATKISNEKTIKVGSVQNLRKRYEK